MAGFWGTIGKVANPIGAVLGGISNAQAKNRGEKLSAQMDLEQLLMQRESEAQRQQIAREQEGRASEGTAWRRLLSAQHALFPGQRPQISPYAAPQRPITNLEQTGADAMSNTALQRLLGGNPIPQVNQHPLEVDRKLMGPGWLERVLGYASLGFGGAGATARQDPRVIQNSGPFNY